MDKSKINTYYKKKKFSYIFKLFFYTILFVLTYAISYIKADEEKEKSTLKLLTDGLEVKNNTFSRELAESASELDSESSEDSIDQSKIPHENIILNITSKHRCYSNEDCSTNGICDLYTNRCHCDLEYTTYVKNYIEIVNNTQIQDLKMCNYNRKKQSTAFILSLVVGFGSEHFYMDRVDVGIAKLAFYFVCCGGNIALFIIYMWFPQKHHLIEFLGKYEAIYMSCGFITAILWVIFDLIKIGNLDYLDGNNVRLLSW
jgi:hypothetical protein